MLAHLLIPFFHTHTQQSSLHAFPSSPVYLAHAMLGCYAAESGAADLHGQDGP